jgi:hypothetical protein
MPFLSPDFFTVLGASGRELPRRSRLRPTSFRAASVLIGLLAGGFHATYAAAETRNPWNIDWSRPLEAPRQIPSAIQVSFAPTEDTRSFEGTSSVDGDSMLGLDGQAAQTPPATPQETANVRPKSFEYSHGYEVRRKIHVYASVAMLPLFGVQAYLGQKLYNGGFSDAERTAHQWVAGAIVGLFALNTVTGIWNLHEGWGDPSHKKLRVTHGMLMLAADVGFAYTALAAPGRSADVSTHSTHRNVAYLSISAATAGYLIMLFGR